MDNIANTLNINLYANASCPNAEYNVSIDDVGQITITPIDANCNFTEVSREPVEGYDVVINLTANMTSSDDNFDYFLDLDDIGQIIITPDSENSNFESVTEGADLNLVTECSHFKVATEGEDLDEYIESDGEPYTYEQVEADLRSLTMNWTREDTLKTGFEVEHQYAMEILSKHYETVYDEGRKGVWYYVRFVGPMVNECLTESKQREFTIFINDDLYCDEDGNPLYFDSYERAAEFIADNELHGGEVVRQAGKAVYEEGLDSEGKKFSNESYKDYNFSVSCNDGPKKNIKLIWDEKDPEGARNVAKKYYAQEHTTYADDRENNWTIEECLSEAYDNYYTNSDVQVIRDKFTKWGFKVDSQHPGFDRYTCKVDDYLLECVFDHKFGTPEEKCFTARVLLNRKTMDYFFNAEDALDFMLANAENKTLDESVQGECKKCGHTLTDSGECPVCDLGDEEERPSHTLYDLDEAVSAADTREILRVAKEIGINNASDLIRFYKDHPACDVDKLAEIQSYRKELGPDFKLNEGARVSFDLDGKNYKGTYRGPSTTNPDMGDVELDDDCYENPDPYGRYINRRPIYNKHEDRYIKDGKFFIPHSELKFMDD